MAVTNTLLYVVFLPLNERDRAPKRSFPEFLQLPHEKGIAQRLQQNLNEDYGHRTP